MRVHHGRLRWRLIAQPTEQRIATLACSSPQHRIDEPMPAARVALGQLDRVRDDRPVGRA